MNMFASILPLQTQVAILALHTFKFLSLLALHEAGRLPPLLICHGGALPRPLLWMCTWCWASTWDTPVDVIMVQRVHERST